MRKVAVGLIGVALGAALVGLAVVAAAVTFLGGTVSEPSASADATAKIPPAFLALYQDAAAGCEGLPWTVLAAIGTVESDNGRSNLPGVQSGANAAGAEGPMQFEPANRSIGNTDELGMYLLFSVCACSCEPLTDIDTDVASPPTTNRGPCRRTAATPSARQGARGRTIPATTCRPSV